MENSNQIKQAYRWLKDNDYIDFLKLFQNFNHFEFFINHIDPYFKTPLDFFTNVPTKEWIHRAFIWYKTPYNGNDDIWMNMHIKYNQINNNN